MPIPSLRVPILLVLAGALAAASAPVTTMERHPVSGGGGQVAVGNLTSGVTAVPPSSVCAATPGIFPAPSSVTPNMIITSLAGEPAPVLLGQPMAGATVPSSGFVWTEAENAAIRDLPMDFGPRNASAVVSEFPTRVDALVETANSFKSVTDAVRWFASWPGVAALSPEVVVAGAARDAIPSVAPLAQADEAEVTDWARPGFDMPSDIQYVMRTGNTVVTIEFLGGEQVTDASTVSFARTALLRVVRDCADRLES